MSLTGGETPMLRDALSLNVGDGVFDENVGMQVEGCRGKRERGNEVGGREGARQVERERERSHTHTPTHTRYRSRGR